MPATSSDSPVALVTGSGSPRIGNHVARSMAARGYRLVVHANTSMDGAHATVRELAGQGTEALAVQADVSQEDQVRRMVAEALDRFGRIDALVNCAAVWNRKKLEDVTAADVDQHWQANTLGTFLCCQHVGLAMVTQEQGGAIVNCGDWAVARPYTGYAAYFPSKGAIVALTRDFAVELASRNPKVRVNAILPGPAMLPESLPEEERQEAINATLVKQAGTPEHIALAVHFFLENDFVTGVCLPVDGGRTVG